MPAYNSAQSSTGTSPHRELWRNLIFTLVVNTAVGVVFALNSDAPMWRVLLTFHIIGLAVFGATVGTFAVVRPTPRQEPYYFIGAIVCGGLLGLTVNWLVRLDELNEVFSQAPIHLLISLAVMTMTAGIVASILWGREKVVRMEAAVHAERSKGAEQEKRLIEAQLRMLQAQIEPHFLFNTLANVQSLIDISPATAKKMLALFNDYLRASLARTRGSKGTVQQEFDLLGAYLGILQIRMGERLSFRLDSPSDLCDCALPPMLLQPLVENAVRHGLEPKVEGGAVAVSVSRTGNWLRLEVSDNGLGLPEAVNGQGVGLGNVRERLASLYGGRARFELVGQAGGGTLARIELPLAD
jgi:LytS/YehU family sensor histidine kinase